MLLQVPHARSSTCFPPRRVKSGIDDRVEVCPFLRPIRLYPHTSSEEMHSPLTAMGIDDESPNMQAANPETPKEFATIRQCGAVHAYRHRPETQ